jgi:hypothetical protein
MGGQVPEPLRIGILGAARIAALAIVDPARATGDRLVAVAARDRRRAEAFAAGHGVERVLDTYADVVCDPEVEVVYNPLANGLHGPWNLAAAAAGRHVLTEKPSASNATEAREVRDAAAAAGVTLLEGFHYRHHPVTRRLHELLAVGELGRLRHVEVDMVIPAPTDDDPRWSLPIGADDALATMELIDACYRPPGSSPAPGRGCDLPRPDPQPGRSPQLARRTATQQRPGCGSSTARTGAPPPRRSIRDWSMAWLAPQTSSRWRAATRSKGQLRSRMVPSGSS